MAFTKEQLCNLALGHLGVTKFIVDLAAETGRSNEATVMNLYYDPAVEFVLEDYPWPELTKYVTLGLVEADPNDDWLYSYRYPSDCIFARRISTSIGRVDPNPPPFETGVDDQGRLIYTDTADAILEYTLLPESPALFRPTLGMAISWWLAGLACPGLAKKKELADRCMKMYVALKSTAQARAGNEQQQSVEPESEMIRARE